MIINWICKQKDWAFGNLCRHLEKKLNTFNHKYDSKDADINFVCSPNFFKGTKGNRHTISHVDSNRWYEDFIK
jgi:hypothetical protein